jgi:(p)ppGpp synthase/HD superfamily hydrolase
MALSARFLEALTWSAQLHAAQLRKGTDVPYFSHVMGVASIVLDYGGDEDEAIAALLHDAVEDQGGAETLEGIRQRFGESVAQIVDGCTDSQEFPKPPWRQRKEEYVKSMRGAPSSVRLVSSADKLHNARAILRDYQALGETLWTRFRGGQDGTLWYYRA